MVESVWDGASVDNEAALARLEDVLLGLPTDRVLPDLDVLLSRAKMSPIQVADDPRVARVLTAAARTRPWGDDAERDLVRTHVSLLEMELDVLESRLAEPDLSPPLLDRTSARLVGVRAELTTLLSAL